MRHATLTLTIAILAAFCLPLGYAASEGPAMWLTMRGVVERQTVENGYRPLMLLGQAWPRFANWRYRYLDLWLPPPTKCGPPGNVRY